MTTNCCHQLLTSVTKAAQVIAQIREIARARGST